MSKVKWIIAGIAAIFLFIVIATPNTTPTETPEPTPGTRAEEIALERVARDEFMSGCLEEGNREYCNCVWDWLMDRYTVEQVIELSEDIESERTSNIIVDASLACIER